MIYTILIGALVGWLAGKIMKGGGFGPLLNILLGILGGVVGSWLMQFISQIFLKGIVGDLVKGLLGALLILFVADALKKKK